MGRKNPEPVAVFPKRSYKGIDVLPKADPLLASRRDGPVVHVGQIHYVKDLIPARLQPAAEQVLKEEGPEVPDVGVVVDCGAAGVERDLALLEWLEELDLPAQGVVEPEGH